jgi:hypothetical protein
MIHSELWIRACQRRIQTAIDRGQSVVISDVRFKNEAEAIRSMGGTILRVIRVTNESQDPHASEAEIESIHSDFLLSNESDLHALRRNVDIMLPWFSEEA